MINIVVAQLCNDYLAGKHRSSPHQRELLQYRWLSQGTLHSEANKGLVKLFYGNARPLLSSFQLAGFKPSFRSCANIESQHLLNCFAVCVTRESGAN